MNSSLLKAIPIGSLLQITAHSSTLSGLKVSGITRSDHNKGHLRFSRILQGLPLLQMERDCPLRLGLLRRNSVAKFRKKSD